MASTVRLNYFLHWVLLLLEMAAASDDVNKGDPRADVKAEMGWASLTAR